MKAKNDGSYWLTLDGKKTITIAQTVCPCGCGLNEIEQEPVEALYHVEQFLGDGIYCTSGHRCKEYNARIGGSSNSRHLTGAALDIAHVHFNPAFVGIFMIAYSFINGVRGVGYYPQNGFIHIDKRFIRKYWLKEKKKPYIYMGAKELIERLSYFLGGNKK